MIKANDQAELSGSSVSWQIVGCGITALVGWSLPPKPGVPATGPCVPAEDRIFTSYVAFQSAVVRNKAPAGATVIFDPEKWIYTPKIEVEDQAKYDVLAGKLAEEYKIKMIFTPEDTSRSRLNADLRAAAEYGSTIELQTQYYESTPSNFKRQVEYDLRIIRAVNATLPVLVGIATDPGGIPAQLKYMVQSYQDTKSLVQGFQLNLAVWRAPYGRGCAQSGCAQLGASFLQSIGQ